MDDITVSLLLGSNGRGSEKWVFVVELSEFNGREPRLSWFNGREPRFSWLDRG